MIKRKAIEKHYRTQRRFIFHFFMQHLDHNIPLCQEMVNNVFIVLLENRKKINDIEKYTWGVCWKMKAMYRRSAVYRYRFRHIRYHDGAFCSVLFNPDKIIAAIDARTLNEDNGG